MALRAGIDIGTNTILLLIAEVEDAKVKRVLEDHVRVVRLGQGVDQNRIFHPEAMQRAMDCFRDYAKILGTYPAIDVRAVATSGSRDAKNSAEFFARVAKETGICIRVISGEEEALLSFRGAMPDSALDPEAIAVLDIGGGSTEIVGMEKKGVDRLFRFSFDMGCVRLTERFLSSDPPQDSQIHTLRNFVKEELAKKNDILEALRGRELVGVATVNCRVGADLGLRDCVITEDAPSGEGFADAARKVASRYRIANRAPGDMVSFSQRFEPPVAVIVRQEIVLFIMGGVFVAETLSVMLQVVYFKATGGKRIFRMAPLHHHYELEEIGRAHV